MNYDVIIVGGGHAGVEAAAAAARRGCMTALVTMDRTKTGVLSCNPAMGGVGKGHIIREVDALDGLIGVATDASGLQFRELNRSKGPAVRGPRAQVDRDLYRTAIQRLLAQEPKLAQLTGQVTDLIVRHSECVGVVVNGDRELFGSTVVLTTGTFLGGVIHRGHERIEAGRVGEAAATRLSDRLRDLALPLGRLKTGTPPRLDGGSIDWARTEAQHGDERPVPLSFLTERIDRSQLPCGITHTNPATHEIIAANVHQTGVHSGTITGHGPRYCPSIEDKIVRFADRPSHQIFLEPEGYDNPTIYPNGISTSLPTDVQLAFLRTINGLKQVEITCPGYAIEYDFVDPRALDRTLALNALPGLFLAGQINGTTGYEEAAGQGVVAGVNAAARALDLDAWIPAREQSYVGVMIDDLTTHGVSEPYRMFTSRAEYRLSLRADNADERLTPVAVQLGFCSDGRATAFHVKQEALIVSRSWMQSTQITPNEAAANGIAVNADGRRRSLSELLAMPNVALTELERIRPPIEPLRDDIRPTLEADALYAGYLARQEAEIERLDRYKQATIPASLDYGTIVGLSNELREKLTTVRPSSLQDASRIEGMTPSALSLLLLALERKQEALAS